MDTYGRERGSIVIGWLTKLFVAMAVVGVALFDVISVSASTLGAKDDANQAASAAGYSWRSTHNVQEAYDAAVESLSSDSESIPPKSFVIDPSGAVSLDVHRITRTMVARHIGPLKHYGVVVAHGESDPPTL